jgi:hypothetical protein
VANATRELSLLTMYTPWPASLRKVSLGLQGYGFRLPLLVARNLFDAYRPLNYMPSNVAIQGGAIIYRFSVRCYNLPLRA